MERRTGPRAAVFGAGHMACGLLGQLLAQSGYRTLFVARRPDVVDAINRHGGYSLVVAGEGESRVGVRNCAAALIQDDSRVVNAVADADLVLTAVGIENLRDIARPIASGLWQRSLVHGDRALNVIACENLPGAGAYLRHQIVGAAPLEHALTLETVGGFSAALTRRIMVGGALREGELTFTVDADCELVIGRQGLRGAFPELQGASFTDEFPILVARKFYTLNCAQAVAAYLGHLHGGIYMHDAAAHPAVEPILRNAVAEAREALKAEFPHHAAGIDRDAADALRRLGNVRLADSIRRVGRQPLRKLSARERLVGPARLARRHGLPHDNLCLAIAAALSYDDPEDPQATALQQVITREGLENVLTESCGLLPHEDLAHLVKRQWLSLRGALTTDGAGPGRASSEDRHGAAPLTSDGTANARVSAPARPARPRAPDDPAPARRAIAKAWFVLERGSPPRLNPVVAEVGARLRQRGVEVVMRYPEEEVVRLDRLSVDADLYLLKSNTELGLSLATAVEGLGGRVLNSAWATALAKNKVAAAAALLQAGVPTPPSLVAGRPAQLVPRLASGPLVLKPYRGHYGAGIAVVDTPDAVPLPEAYPDVVFAQKYLARARTDLKVFAIGDDVFGVRKTFSAGSFLQAGEPTTLSPQIEEIARRCGKALGLQLYGVDIVEDADDVYVVDVNAFPGYRGVPAAAQRLTDYIYDALATPANG
jgi:mannitol-1-phosphate 5-dehydrogenase